MNAALFLVVVVTVGTSIAHPMFVVCDRRLSRRRLHTSAPSLDDTPLTARHDDHRPTRVPLPRRRTSTRSEPLTFRHSSQCLDDFARRLRLGVAPVDAFSDSLRSAPELWSVCAGAARSAQHTGDVRSAIETMTAHTHRVVRAFSTAVWVAHSGAGVNASALERAAQLHRDRFAIQEEKLSATAASRYSTLVLSVLPLAGLVLSPAWGASTLSSILRSPVMLITVVIGAALNVCGLVWARRVAGIVA